ncbi:MAG: type II toxin-antitoxin system VapC family toxin [Cryobacterium sp.]|nr:type II toxin-antitoxin system VapC family toxin [Cryobacterium sp.]
MTPRYYLDTSAAVKLIVEEAESDAIAAFMDRDEISVTSSLLLETELRRYASRHELNQNLVTDVLERVPLSEIPPSLYREAGLLPGSTLRSLDALHLTSALRSGADTIVTYDERLALSAEALGMRVVAPRHTR